SSAAIPADSQSAAPQLPEPPSGRDRVVITGMVPIPNVGAGAPYHSPEELAALSEKTQKDILHTDAVDMRTRMCRLNLKPPGRLSMNYPSLEALMDAELATGRRLATEADRARLATEAAEASRRAAADGKEDAKSVEQAELARQAAVNKAEEARVKYLEAGAAIADLQDFERQGYTIADLNQEAAPSGKVLTWGDLDVRADRRRKAGYWQGVPVPDPAPGLHIEQVEARQTDGKHGPVVEITGLLRNDRNGTLSVPGLTIVAIDKQGQILAATAIDASGSSVPAQSSRAFAYELTPAPQAIARVSVTFASSLAPPPRTYLKPPPGCDDPGPPG
ncbi:MAG TPA: hypothetical protein VG942_08610, partial [Hyphomonadaceae bacterium]|nr:hypothetical protein [Hyphomonadaceae bacterium]